MLKCGGVFGKGCIDGTYNVKQALHTLSQHGADSYVIFADLVKAYDTVDRELLWKIMRRYRYAWRLAAWRSAAAVK